MTDYTVTFRNLKIVTDKLVDNDIFRKLIPFIQWFNEISIKLKKSKYSDNEHNKLVNIQNNIISEINFLLNESDINIKNISIVNDSIFN
tara:strand:- start:363 stop:629 length:267 start_codon:yes stop_codon:yes gene_type:complete